MLEHRPASPADFETGAFPGPVACSEAQSAALAAEAQRLVEDMIHRVRWEMHVQDSSRGWKLSSSKRHFRDTGIRTYTRKSEAPMDRKARGMDFRCMGTVNVSLDQAMEALYSDNTADFRRNTAFLLDGCLDAAVLQVIKSRTKRDPFGYVGINWVAVRNPGLFSKKRDILYLRSTGKTRDATGNKVGYVLMRTVELKECPSLEQSHGFIRTKLSAIMLFKENRDAQSSSVLFEGHLPLLGSSASKILEFLHTGFTSCIANVNVYNVAQVLTRQTEAERFTTVARERKTCSSCNKKFSLLRARRNCDACGELMCRDCEITRKVSSFGRETMDTRPPQSDKDGTQRYCKRCVVSARKQADTESEMPLEYDFTATNPTESNSQVAEEHDERISNVSETNSQCSIQLTWPELTKLGTTIKSRPTSGGGSSSTSTSGTTSRSSTDPPVLSTSEIPLSPLSVKSSRTRMNRRDRLETDPWEHYDAFDEPCEEPSNHEPEPHQAFKARNSHSDAKDLDFAARLWEISCKAQETLDTTRRNSCMMSDTSSAPRNSDLPTFHNLDKSIAEQADLLNVIGFVSTGRVYMETPDTDGVESVRMSESSLEDEDRFEILA